MATLLVLYGPNEGEWYTVPDHKSLVVGRDNRLLAELLDVSVSRRHMEVRYDQADGNYYVMDLQSRNGVRRNGAKVRKFHQLNDDDLLQIGYTLMLFTVEDFQDDDEAWHYIKRAQRQHVKWIQKIRAHEKKKKGRRGLLKWLRSLVGR